MRATSQTSQGCTIRHCLEYQQLQDASAISVPDVLECLGEGEGTRRPMEINLDQSVRSANGRRTDPEPLAANLVAQLAGGRTVVHDVYHDTSYPDTAASLAPPRLRRRIYLHTRHTYRTSPHSTSLRRFFAEVPNSLPTIALSPYPRFLLLLPRTPRRTMERGAQPPPQIGGAWNCR